MRRIGLAITRKSLLPPTLALQSLLAALALFDAFHVRYLATILRAVADRTFSLGFSLTPALLLISSISLIYLLSRRRYRAGFISTLISLGLHPLFGLDASAAVFAILLVVATLSSSAFFEDYLFWILALLAGLEIMALIYWIFLVPAPPLEWFVHLEQALFGIAANLAPLLAILTMSMWVIKPVIKPRLKAVGKFLISSLNIDTSFKEGGIHLNPRALLILSVVVSVVGALHPYRPDVNPESMPVGIDIKSYVKTMASVEQDPSSAFTVFGSRPMILLMMYALKHIIGLEFLEVVKYLPVLLNPLLTLSVYFMVSQATGDKEWAGLASLFTALGFKVTVGMYSYYLANLLCLTLIFLALGFLFKNLRTENSSIPVAASALASLAVFTHPWTFIQFYAPIVLVGFTFGYRYLKGVRSGRFFTILIFLSVTGLVDVLKGVVLGGLEGYGAMASTVPYQLSIGNFWKNNIFTFTYLYGGFLSNSILLGIAAVGVYILNRRKLYPFFLISLLSTSSIYYFISHIMLRGRPYNNIPARILYNIPFGVLTALVILSVLRNINLKKRVRITTLIFVTLYMTVYLLRSLANLIY